MEERPYLIGDASDQGGDSLMNALNAHNFFNMEETELLALPGRFESRIFSHNLQRKNFEQWHKRVVKKLAASHHCCVTLLQEVQSWTDCEYAGSLVLSEVGCDSGIVLPQDLRSTIRRTVHEDLFSAVQVWDLIFIAAHPPHSSRPEHELLDVMERVTKLVQP
eukprot:6623882-Pyramimonas_sp.AAC.1